MDPLRKPISRDDVLDAHLALDLVERLEDLFFKPTSPPKAPPKPRHIAYRVEASCPYHGNFVVVLLDLPTYHILCVFCLDEGVNRLANVLDIEEEQTN